MAKSTCAAYLVIEGNRIVFTSPTLREALNVFDPSKNMAIYGRLVSELLPGCYPKKTEADLSLKK